MDLDKIIELVRRLKVLGAVTVTIDPDGTVEAIFPKEEPVFVPHFQLVPAEPTERTTTTTISTPVPYDPPKPVDVTADPIEWDSNNYETTYVFSNN